MGAGRVAWLLPGASETEVRGERDAAQRCARSGTFLRVPTSLSIDRGRSDLYPESIRGVPWNTARGCAVWINRG